jgi:hypothetical protein
LRTVQIVKWSHMSSHIRCMYPPKEHITPKVGLIVEVIVQDSWDGLTCLTSGACTTQGTHLHPKVGQDSWEDSPG